MNQVLTIDPGLQGTGFAFWHRSGSDRFTLIDAGVLNTPSSSARDDWWRRADDLGCRLHERFPSADEVYCEMPEFMATPSRAMGWKTGDLQRLTYLVGLFAGYFRVATFTPVPVRVWKGQLPKDVVELRCRDAQRKGRFLVHNPVVWQGVRLHAWDAVGIGLWVMGGL